MNKLQQHYLVMVLYTVILLFNQSNAKDEDLMCGVCMAVVNDVNISIRSQDPKKKLKVGSFRVDPQGNQPYVKEIPYARSEQFLIEIFEKLCDKMSQFGVTVDKDTKKRAVIRKYNLDNSMKGLNIDENISKKLKYVCSDFIEEYEEAAIEVFQVEEEKTDDTNQRLCVEKLGLCSTEEMEYQKGAQSAGIRSAIFNKNNVGEDGILKVSPGGANEEGDDDDDDDDDDEDEILKDVDSEEEIKSEEATDDKPVAGETVGKEEL